MADSGSPSSRSCVNFKYGLPLSGLNFVPTTQKKNKVESSTIISEIH